MKETRPPFLFGFFLIASILGFSFYLEYIRHIFPCPLCELQRFAFALIGCLFLLGACLHRFRCMRYLFWCLIALTSFGGTLLASKQVWLQHFPSAVKGVCGASISYLLKVFPIDSVISHVFAGSVECTERGWDFLSLDLAEWALISFIGFLCYAIFCIIREWRQTKQS